MTVLIIGGSFQGKREIAEKLYPDEPKIYNLHEKVREMLQKGNVLKTLIIGLITLILGPAGTFCNAARPCDHLR